MISVIKIIWIIAIVVALGTLSYFLIASTAFFSRSTGTEWGYYFLVIGSSATILIIISIVCLTVGWMPQKFFSQIVLLVSIIFITFMTIYIAPLPIDPEGWLTDRVSTLGFMQTTDDGKYEYNLEIINAYQRNSHARLHVRDTATDEEVRIPLNMRNERITIYLAVTHDNSLVWAYLTLSENSSKTYILTTTKYLNNNIEVFEIDMETKTSHRLR
ncbi:MAG: hypothetical protein LBC96_09570 [Lachnospiraceae bacterium]|jgi:hypothetical protein|nr:hypothetical protein [Lachnospiraceae bacterium]